MESFTANIFAFLIGMFLMFTAFYVTDINDGNLDGYICKEYLRIE